MKNMYRKIGLWLLVFIPVITFAADKKDLKYIARLVTEYLNIGISLIVALAVVFFVWNVFKYFFTDKEKKEAGLYVMYSIIGFFVILSFWGMVAIVRNSLKLEDEVPVIPSLDFGTPTTRTGPVGGMK
jgi:O-antigen/teichoic acid export membrane protein